MTDKNNMTEEERQEEEEQQKTQKEVNKLFDEWVKTRGQYGI